MAGAHFILLDSQDYSSRTAALGGLVSSIRGYQRGNRWGIGADLLKTANNMLANDYTPAKTACEAARGTANEQSLCSTFEGARRRLNEHIGFIDVVRRFNARAEKL